MPPLQAFDLQRVPSMWQHKQPSMISTHLSISLVLPHPGGAALLLLSMERTAHTSRQGYTCSSLCPACWLYWTPVSVYYWNRTQRGRTQEGNTLPNCVGVLTLWDFSICSQTHHTKRHHSLEQMVSDYRGESQASSNCRSNKVVYRTKKNGLGPNNIWQNGIRQTD